MPSADTAALARRLGRARARLDAEQLDALVVTHPPNLFYLTNFRGTSGAAVLTARHLYIITDFRYIATVGALLESAFGPPDASPVPVDRTYDETLVRVLRTLGPARIGIEAAHLTVQRYCWLSDALGVPAPDAVRHEASPARAAPATPLVRTERLIERLRVRKDAGEIRTLRTAAAMLSEVARTLPRLIRRGMAERELAADIDRALAGVGFERPAFETIVASGPNSAHPHARPGPRRLAAGDLVILDFGGVYDGYCVDLTRTASIGSPDAERTRWHEGVRAAQKAAVEAVAPGVPAGRIDRAARDLLAARGLAEYFGHGTGHGLGIEVHEDPRLAREREDAPSDPVAADMVFTIEPGVYVPGAGGVRIEDDVLVTETGREVLTDATRELLVR